MCDECRKYSHVIQICEACVWHAYGCRGPKHVVHSRVQWRRTHTFAVTGGLFVGEKEEKERETVVIDGVSCRKTDKDISMGSSAAWQTDSA